MLVPVPAADVEHAFEVPGERMDDGMTVAGESPEGGHEVLGAADQHSGTDLGRRPDGVGTHPVLAQLDACRDAKIGHLPGQRPVRAAGRHDLAAAVGEKDACRGSAEVVMQPVKQRARRACEVIMFLRSAPFEAWCGLTFQAEQA